MKNFVLLILAVVGFANLRAQSIFTNPINGINPNLDNPYTTGQTVNANITVSGIGRGTGIAGVNTNDRYNASGWDSGTLDVNDYFTFTLSPNATYDIDFVSLVYIGQASGTGPVNFALRSSVDGFSTNIGTPVAGSNNISLAAAMFQNRVGPVEFRLYAWGATGAGEYSINSFTFNGTVSLCGPSVAPSGLTISNITTNSMELAWASNGNGDNVLVVGKIGSAVDFVPVNGVTYNNGQNFSGNVVMYKGNSSGVVLSSLFSNSEYHFAIFSFNSGGPCYNLSPLTGTATTECNPSNVTGLSGNCGNTIAAPAWTHASCYDEYLVVAKEGSSISGTPTGDGSAYNANLAYGAGDAFDGGFIVYKGSNDNTGGNITGLNIGVNYYFKVFTRRGTLWNSGVETTCSPSIPTVSTDFFRSNVASGNWSNVSSWQSSPDGILWSNASAVPTMDASGLTIRNGHNITSSTSRTIPATTVAAGGTLTISTGILTLSDDGTAAHDLIIFGTVVHQSASAWAFETGATWIIQNGGTYVHQSGAAIAATLNNATISSNSNFIYRNTNSLSLSGRTYGNLSFENTTLIPISGTAGGGDPITVLGNLRIGTLYTINNALSNIWDIRGDFRIDGAFNISSNDGPKIVRLGGDLTVSGGADLFENTSGNGTIIFDGVEEQWLNASGDILNEVHFTIENPEGVGLLSHLLLPADLNLTGGHLSLYNFNFEIVGVINGVSSTRYIRTNGTGKYSTLVSTTPVLFPIGNSAYNPLLMSITAGSALLGARVIDQVLLYGLTGTPYTDRVVDRLWEIAGDLAGEQLTLTVQWNEDEELGTFDRQNSYVSQFLNGIWNPSAPSPASGTDPYTHTISGITALSVFGVGYAGALPVNLLTFNTLTEKNNQLVYWTFESAERFDYFELEHSRDAKNFNVIEKVSAAEFTTKSGEAKYLHLNPGAGIHYYRLKMVDLDGTFKHSNVIQGKIEGKGSVRPVSTFISSEGINIAAENNISVLELKIVDQLGRIVYQSIQSAEAGVFNISLNNLNAGLYYLQINADGIKETHRLIR